MWAGFLCVSDAIPLCNVFLFLCNLWMVMSHCFQFVSIEFLISVNRVTNPCGQPWASSWCSTPSIHLFGQIHWSFLPLQRVGSGYQSLQIGPWHETGHANWNGSQRQQARSNAICRCFSGGALWRSGWNPPWQVRRTFNFLACFSDLSTGYNQLVLSRRTPEGSYVEADPNLEKILNLTWSPQRLTQRTWKTGLTVLERELCGTCCSQERSQSQNIWAQGPFQISTLTTRRRGNCSVPLQCRIWVEALVGLSAVVSFLPFVF